MIKVLFICAANLNRSPMAEAIFSQLVKERGLNHLFLIDSAATNSFHVGKRPAYRTRQFLTKKQIPHDWIQSRLVTPKDFEEYHYILAMDNENLHKLKKILANHELDKKIPLLLEYLPEAEEKNMPDPSVTGDYMKTYELIQKSCENLLKLIIEKEGLEP